jgi:hypothetical protein
MLILLKTLTYAIKTFYELSLKDEEEDETKQSAK